MKKLAAAIRYARGEGSWSKGQMGRRQVTLINPLFVQGSGFGYAETRRNIATLGVELIDSALIGQEFLLGDAVMRGLNVLRSVPQAITPER